MKKLLTLVLMALFVLPLTVTTRLSGSATAGDITPPVLTRPISQSGDLFGDLCDVAPVLCNAAPSSVVASDNGSTPTIVFVSPAVGARAVPTNTLISATFGEDMDPGTINSNTFTVSHGATTVVGSVTYIAVSRVAVFYPCQLPPVFVHP